MASLMRFLANLLRVLTLPLLRAVGGVAWTLAIPAMRALAGVFLIVAAVALASDAGPVSTGAQKSFQPTAVVAHWQQIAPASLEGTRDFLTKRTKPWVWDAFSAPLRLPAFVFFGGLGLVFGYFGRRRRRVEIFVN